MPPSPDAPAPITAGPLRPGTFGDRAVDLTARALIRAARAMPYERRVPFMGAVMRSAAAPLAGWSARAQANLAATFPDWPEARRRQVASEALDNFGRTLIENYSPQDLARHLAGTSLRGEGVAALDAAQAEGRPILFVTGHFGNYEVPRHLLQRRGIVVAPLIREMSNPYVNEHYTRMVGSVSGPVFGRRTGLRGFMRWLSRGGSVAMLFDLHVAEGVPIPFLGRPAMTSLAAGDLALRYGALLVPAFGIRQPDGLGFEAVIEAPIPPSTPLAMLEEATRRLEARILAHPGQWLWSHRRWKPGRERRGAERAPGPVSPPPAPPP